MTTYPLPSESGPPAAAGARAHARELLRRIGPPEALGLALLAVLAYAAFAHGAVQTAAAPRSPDEPRLQVAVAVLASLALAVWLWGGRLRLAAPRLALAGIGLLALFIAWNVAGLAWTVSPDGTWLEVNRYATYLIVLLLAVIVGASAGRATELVQGGFIVVAGLVTLYAIGQKLVPWVHIGGLIDLNRTQQVPRVQDPLGYWNALALFIGLAVPLTLAVCVDTSQRPLRRLAALAGLELMCLAIGLTYSRGGLAALALGLIAALALGGARLRGLLWFAAAVVGSAGPLALALSSHALTTAGASLSTRSKTGGELVAVVLVTLIALVLGGRRIIALESTVRVTPARARGIARGLLALAGAVVVIALIVVAVSHRGLPGTISHAYHSFTSTSTGNVNVNDPNHLLSADSTGRWGWWKEAAGAFGAKPLQGWGAGSFPVVHLLYRRNNLTVQQPHSAPLQFLSETGLIGTVLILGAFLALVAAALRAVRLTEPGRPRLAAAALLGAVIAYALHACYDYDSDIPGVTLPMLVFLGVLVGTAPRTGGSARTRGAQDAYLPMSLGPRGPARVGPTTRLLAIIVTTLGLCALAVSAVLPQVAIDRASSADLTASSGPASALEHAQKEALLASRLDPLSDSGLLAEALVALSRRQLKTARQLDAEAIRRNPSDVTAWTRLLFVEILGQQNGAAVETAQHVLELDPQGLSTQELAGGEAQGANALQTLPQSSPTNTQTPESTSSSS